MSLALLLQKNAGSEDGRVARGLGVAWGGLPGPGASAALEGQAPQCPAPTGSEAPGGVSHRRHRQEWYKLSEGVRAPEPHGGPEGRPGEAEQPHQAPWQCPPGTDSHADRACVRVASGVPGASDMGRHSFVVGEAVLQKRG